jgi:hypothetical protein
MLPNAQLVKCEYDEPDQRRILSPRLEEILAAYRSGTAQTLAPVRISPPGETPEEAVVRHVYSHVVTVGARIKHDSFREESEWRLVVGPVSYMLPEVNFRPGKFYLKPYYKLSWANTTIEPLVEVRIGPGPHMNLASDALWMYLNSRMPTTPKIERSRIPYRDS